MKLKRRSYRLPNQASLLLGLAQYFLKASLRNRASYFFSFVFPIVFITVFGLFGNGNSPLKLGIPDTLSHDNAIYQTLEKIAAGNSAPLTFVTGSQAELEQKVSQGKLGSVIEPADSTKTTVQVVTSNGNPAGKAASESFLNGVISQLNLQAAHLSQPPFTLQNKEISGRSYRYIDFALPGQIGFSLLSLATFGVAFTFITLRKTLVLKRLFATTVKPFTFVVAQALSRSFQAMLQGLVIIAVGVVAFHFYLAHGWTTVIEMLILSFLGILGFLGFGILISNLAKDEQTLPIVLNLFNLPQFLLSGVFFPIDDMPKYVRLIGNNLPLSYVNIAMRKIANEGASLTSVWPYIVGLFAWAVLSYILAALTFKSE